MVFAACDFRNGIHLGLDDFADCLVVFVHCFAALEIDVAILRADLCDRLLWADAARAELFYRLLIDHLRDCLIRDFFVFVDFVRCAESVEELQERNLCRICREMRDKRHVEFFLNGIRDEHREACVAACHDVRVVAEDCQRLAGE